MNNALLFGAVALALWAPSADAASTWTGAGGFNWATPSSWQGSLQPTPADTVVFTDSGSSSVPNDLTSFLNASRTIAGLTFTNSSGKYQTLDLAGFTLTVTGNLNVNLNSAQTSLATIRNGSLVFSGPFSSINVGRSASSAAIGMLDLSGLSSLNGNLQQLQIGTVSSGSATGSLTLASANTLSATSVLVGTGILGTTGGGTLRLGMYNMIATSQLSIAQTYSNGAVLMPAGGTLVLGSVAQPTSLAIGISDTYTDSTYNGRLDLTGGTFIAHLADVTVADRSGGAGPGLVNGILRGGNKGTVTIGDPDHLANVVIGRSSSGGGASGIVDFSGLQSLTANLNQLIVGQSNTSDASGSFSLPATNTISANTILVGNGTVGEPGYGTLTLGRNSTIITPQLSIASTQASGYVQMGAAGSLTLGSPTQHASVTIGLSDTYADPTFNGRLDLTGSTFTGYLGNLKVGDRSGGDGPGSATGTFIAGNNGSVEIGTAASPATVIIGRNLRGGGSSGIVDFSGLSSLSAQLTTLSVGISTSATATGRLLLAANNSISASAIIVGAGGPNAYGTLSLGMSNVIRTGQLVVGQNYANGFITIPSGGSLTLGTPSQLTSLNIATGVTSNGGTYLGAVDLTGARLTAYLDTVIIGSKDSQSGSQLGALIISNLPDNYIQANSVFLGGTNASGTLTFAGGTFFVGDLSTGAGTAAFNWTGGTFHPVSFGTSARPFNLNNTGAGTLAPGTPNGAIGTSAIYGNYTQGPAAGMMLRIVGNTPSSGNDLVTVSGTASLNGRLSLSTPGGFLPGSNQNYLLMSYGSRVGTFGFISPPSMPEDVAFVLDYMPTQLWLRTMSPVSQNWISSATTGSFNLASNWSAAQAPATTSALSINNTIGSPQSVTVGNSVTVHRVTLSTAGAPLFFEVPTGVILGVANKLVIGANASLIGGGQVLGNVEVLSGGLVAAQSAATLSLNGSTTSAGIIRASGSATLAINGAANLGGIMEAVGGTLQINAPGAALNAPLTLVNGTAQFNAPDISAGHISGSGTLSIGAIGNLLATHISVSNLLIHGSLSLRSSLPSASASKVNTVSISGSTNNWTGTLDLTTNALVVQSSSADRAAVLVTLQNQLASGRAGGTWTGPGITSSSVAADPAHLALALADNADLHYTTFRGQYVDDNALIITQAAFGDANLDFKVDAFDLNLLASHWQQQTGAQWSAGDSTGDGKVDAFDLNALAANWQYGAGGSLSTAFFQFPISTVPESATLAIVALTIPLLIRRRQPFARAPRSPCQ